MSFFTITVCKTKQLGGTRLLSIKNSASQTQGWEIKSIKIKYIFDINKGNIAHAEGSTQLKKQPLQNTQKGLKEMPERNGKNEWSREICVL